VLVLDSSARNPGSSCVSTTGPYGNEQTGTQYSSVLSSGLGHCPKIALINKGLAELHCMARATSPVFPSSKLVVALSQSKSNGCLVFFSSRNPRIGALTVSLLVANMSKSFILPKGTHSEAFSFVKGCLVFLSSQNLRIGDLTVSQSGCGRHNQWFIAPYNFLGVLLYITGSVASTISLQRITMA